MIEKNEGSLEKFANSYKLQGLFKTQNSVSFREWAPGAEEMFLMGDFNGWRKDQYRAQRDSFGNWSLDIPHIEGRKIPLNANKSTF